LGEAIRRGDTPDDYLDVLSWYGDLGTTLQQTLVGSDWSHVSLRGSPEITSRAKTIDTLRQKLDRERSIPLQNIVDIAGARFEAEMSLAQQDAVVRTVLRRLGQFKCDVRDLRSRPHSGYRAVHVWVQAYGGRAEIQIRTHLQGAWANMYEAAGDRFGRKIRYGELPEDSDAASVVAGLQLLSTRDIASYERGLVADPDFEPTLRRNLRELRDMILDLPESRG
jgi:ppGpp synthetase/RelA/SpoT-type nucleotidyltranferase